MKKLQNSRDIMTNDRVNELRKNKLKEFAGIAYEAGALIFELFGS